MFKKKDQTKKIMQDPISNEQIRIIRTNLESISEGKSAIFMVTSTSEDGEKSIISSKLAISFVEQGKSVLLVDANIRNPSLHHWFQMQNQSGFTNVIVNEDEIKLHIRETYVPGLFILPTGPIPLNSSEIWVTNKIIELVRNCESEFDVVIFEAAPYLTAADSQVLASQCDGVILVIKENKTKKEELLKTKENLERTNNKIFGVIYQTG
ncbi:CpsD/CapB family tyrosine-protein kinase [Neobacillus bataviensis]|uniref:CpsD/CapB family tyrosine-protein kinase n=1 Tax=Neobacillus bataviensis TaxID=220685 RepID=UPI001CBADC7F|nr:CpsD/CapB family tyrosine-protein kinase [Neobacillus bataviensis]